MTASTRASTRRLLTAGLAAVTLTTVLPSAAAQAAPASPAATGVLAAAEADSSLATYEQKLAVAVKFGRGDDTALIERGDRDFVIEIWKHVKDNGDFLEVRAAAEQAYGTMSDDVNPDATSEACYEFIATGVFAAYDRDIEREKREAEAKRLSDQARAAAAASIDVVADAAMLAGTDADFARLVWTRVENDANWPKVKAAAAAAVGGTAEQQREFIAAGMAAAAKQDTDKRIADDAAKTEAEKAAALARAAKQFAANRIGLPVTEQLLSMPDRDFVVAVWNHEADGTEVQTAAISAARNLDPAAWKAFIDTGLHQAKDRDIQIALDKQEAEDRRQAKDVQARAEKVGNRNLALAARNALAGNADAVGAFVRAGQYAVRPDLPDRLQAGHTGMCLGVPGGSLKKGEHIIQWQCSSAQDQGWVFLPKADGYFEVRNSRSGQCLAIGSASKENSAHAIQWTCNGGKEQLWAPQADSTGLTRLKNNNSGKCLGILGASKTGAAHAVQEPCAAKPELGWHKRARGLVNFSAGSFNGDAHEDVIAAEVGSGKLWLYPGTAKGDAFAARMLIGNAGWNGMDKLTTGRFNRDEHDDLIAVEKSTGKLWLYPGNGRAGLGSRVEIGTGGWNGMEKLAAGRFNTDAYDDVVAVETSSDKLWLYPGTAAGGAFGARVLLGTGGWNNMDKLTMGKINRDGYEDLVTVQKSTGKLFFYVGTATGVLGARTEIGTGGWNGMSELTAGRFNADEYDDLIATENSSGKLFRYPGTAEGGKVGGRTEIGIGG
ncbi:RICIN domain-containing protein [Couchioplanes caeruleus]|uniref:Ricin B lectin domain-containing protein n=2 Tax=Couchioplanes caeruleus TaxID=56438 RepID=A0A1K0GI74_9ACTN|nr:RICIN domain-containing protein [Couchioplanes caeruleus]OJF11934.1 hypothetical protein BG844_23525 [Couchioplanes caeruleus subsp. caeruleus]